MSSTLTLALVQQATVWHDRDANLSKAADFVAKAAGQGARVVVFPELLATGFTMAAAEFAEPLPGPTSETLAALAQRHGVWIVGTTIEQGPERPFNTAFALRPDGTTAAVYRKLHPFSFGDENNHYSPGDDCPTFELDGLRAGLQICYDLRFPETFRSLSSRGVELCFVVANWPTRRARHWSTLLAARAIENQMVVCGVNRAGEDPNVSYPGLSTLLDARGEPIAQGGADEALVVGAVDFADVAQWRAQFPALRDRRHDLYRRLG